MNKIIATAAIAALVFALGTTLIVHAHAVGTTTATYKSVDGWGEFDRHGHWHCIPQYDSSGNSECV
jgi:hypothetical protein